MDRVTRLAAGLVAALACTAPGTAGPLDQEVELAPGKPVKVPSSDISLTFDSVAEDSRCPIGAQCVWAGNAKVLLRLTARGNTTAFVLNSTTQPQIGIDDYTFTLTQLTPVPSTSGHPAAGDYRVTLRVRHP